MRCALDLAHEAEEAGEIPVGCVIVAGGEMIGQARNSPIALLDPTAHAEMLALRQAAIAAANYRLTEATVYCTLEPCPMCAGAIVQARIPLVFYGATDPKAGGCHTLFQITSDIRLNHQAVVMGGILQEESRRLLQEFFAQQRRLGKK